MWPETEERRAARARRLVAVCIVVVGVVFVPDENLILVDKESGCLIGDTGFACRRVSLGVVCVWFGGMRCSQRVLQGKAIYGKFGPK
jgi:hypothetical protein